MKRIVYILVFLFLHAAVSAQTDVYERRYELLVSQLGPAGVGVETVLDNWSKVDSTNVRLLMGRFNYLFEKSRSTEVVVKPEKKYLGMEPLLSLKDSLGNDVYYYQVSRFDDALYGEALKAADRAISFHPDILDFRFMKANAYIAYEQESPDMALDYLVGLVDDDALHEGKWVYDGTEVDDAFFSDAMQEYCYSFYSLGTPQGYEAFLALSGRLLEAFPDNPAFMNNIAAYHLVAKKDYKTAFKWYNKVLKKHPGDMTAIMNAMNAARKQNNVKLERKYLEMLVEYGSDKEKLQAQGRLKALEGRK
ncbi:MAG: hypothetical protein IJ005_06710 [Bacteroidales bacterium]|nr:hypothetical protein [Bacteroidales bacterium]